LTISTNTHLSVMNWWRQDLGSKHRNAIGEPEYHHQGRRLLCGL
jgi:hypothetical protein